MAIDPARPAPHADWRGFAAWLGEGPLRILPDTNVYLNARHAVGFEPFTG